MIKLVNVSKYYSSNGAIALGLRKANLELHVNEFVAVIGESGSGKTTLLNVISGIDSYEEGEMYLNDQETSYYSTSDLENYRKKYVAFVFQNYNLVDSFTVRQNVELPMLLAGYSAKEARARAYEIIKKVGLESHINHKATKLSGGQKQRVVIARALAKDCPIIAADEPTGNLDSESAKQIWRLLHEISKDKLVIVVTHDFSQVQEYATRKIRIYDGEIVEDQKLRKTEIADLPEIPDEARKIKLSEHIKMAFKTLFAAPKKTILMVFVFFAFAFLVSLVYGLYNLQVTGQSGYTDDYTQVFFRNKSISRMIVRKTDKTAFTATELLELEGLSQVQTLVERDYVMDIRFYIRSQEVFEDLHNNAMSVYEIKFLPLSVLDESDLWAGEWPSADDEVVIVLPKAETESTEFQQFYLDEWYEYVCPSDLNCIYEANYKITGLVKAEDVFMDNGYYLAVSEAEYKRSAQAFYHIFIADASFVSADNAGKEIYSEWLIDNFGYGTAHFVLDTDLDADQVKLNKTRYEYYFCGYDAGECTVTDGRLYIEDAYVTNTFSNIEVIFDIGISSDEIHVSEEIYNQIFYDDVYQLSVISNTDVNVGRLINNILSIKEGGVAKYKVIYPKTIKSTDQLMQALAFFETLGTLVLLVVTILGATLLSYLIFRLVINTKLRDYAIFRTVGANQNMIQLLIYFENIITVSFSYVLFVGLSIVIKNISIIDRYSPLYGLKVFTFENYLVFFGIVILMAVLISGRYCRRVFQDTVQTALKLE
ncbi:MAG: ATP-binding cassette domain-containing protein [Candidatus Izemoplasmatales bacterium]|jgi:putative ABC transport system permease protein